MPPALTKATISEDRESALVCGKRLGELHEVAIIIYIINYLWSLFDYFREYF